MSVERDDTHCVPVQGKTLNGIKAELIRAFLTVFCLLTSGEMSIRDLDSRTFSFRSRSELFPSGIQTRSHCGWVRVQQRRKNDGIF